MKKNLIKIASLLLVLAMIFSFAACKKDKDNGDSTAPSESSDVGGSTGDETLPADASTEDPSAESTEAETVTDDSGKVVETKPADSGKTPAAPPAGSKMPSGTAAILNYYNAATKAAFDGRVGFKKHRETGNEKIESNAIVKQFKKVIYGFIGIGEENAYNETVTKGQWSTEPNKYYLRASTLGTGDVSGASCKQNGANYVITINIKNGNSYATKGTATCNAPLDKSGICVGDKDKHYYDHKRASVIYDAIDEVFGNAKVTEKYSGAVLTATVDAATGRLVKINIKFDIYVNVDLGAAGKPTATGTTTVTYSDFKY